jgi:DNA polymerase III gamma/tau subunit
MAKRTYESLKKEISSKEARQNYDLQQWDELLTQVRESNKITEMERFKLENSITGAIEKRKDPLFTPEEDEEEEEWASDWLLRVKGIGIAEFNKMDYGQQKKLQDEFDEHLKKKKPKKEEPTYYEPKEDSTSVVEKPKKKQMKKEKAKKGKQKPKKEEPDYYEHEEKSRCIPLKKVKEVRDKAKWLDTKFYDNGLVHIEEYVYENCYYQVQRVGRMPKFKDKIIFVEERRR